MSYQNTIDASSVALHLERHVVKAVHHRGLATVLRVAVVAWWNQPRLPPDLPARLRADMGLPPETRPRFWPEPSLDPQVPPPLWIPGL